VLCDGCNGVGVLYIVQSNCEYVRERMSWRAYAPFLPPSHLSSPSTRSLSSSGVHLINFVFTASDLWIIVVPPFPLGTLSLRPFDGEVDVVSAVSIAVAVAVVVVVVACCCV